MFIRKHETHHISCLTCLIKLAHFQHMIFWQKVRFFITLTEGHVMSCGMHRTPKYLHPGDMKGSAFWLLLQISISDMHQASTKTILLIKDMILTFSMIIFVQIGPWGIYISIYKATNFWGGNLVFNLFNCKTCSPFCCIQ